MLIAGLVVVFGTAHLDLAVEVPPVGVSLVIARVGFGDDLPNGFGGGTF
jgi:hypothetical protein